MQRTPLPPPKSVSLQQAGELAHLQFEATHKHGFYVTLRLHYPPGSTAPKEDLRLLNVRIPTHLTIRRTDAANSAIVFDDAVDAMPMGWGADSFDRNLRGKFELPPGHYDVVVTLLEAVPKFAAYPTDLSIGSDRGHAVYKE